MKKALVLSAITAASVAITPVAHSATRPSRARLVIELTGADSPSCGITEATTKSAIHAVMAHYQMTEEAGPQTTNDDPIPTIFFSGKAAKVNGQCAGFFIIQFFSLALGPVPWARDETIVSKSVYCQIGGFTSGETSTFSKKYIDGVQLAMDNCFTQMASNTNLAVQ